MPEAGWNKQQVKNSEKQKNKYSPFKNISSFLLHLFNNRHIFAYLMQKVILIINTIHILNPKFYVYENQDLASFNVSYYN
jgi:hypothetical protein